MSHKHLLIIVVSYFDEMNRQLFHGVQNALGPLQQMGWTISMNEHVGNADLGRARNAVAAQFLAMSTMTDLLCLDGDVSWDAGSLERLMSHPNVDLVAGCYPQRFDTGHFPVRWLPGPLTPINPSTGEPAADGLLEVEGVPAGFMRITRAGMERMARFYADSWYWEPLVTPLDGEPLGKAWQLFEFTVYDRGRWSEDLSFCRKFRDAGGRVWVDPLISLHHHGRKTFSGQLGNWLLDRSLPPGASLPGAPSPGKAVAGLAEALDNHDAVLAKMNADRPEFLKAFGMGQQP